MKTQGEIEAAICEGISRFEQEYRGRGPKDIHAYLLGDFVVVRLQGLLTPAEQHLAKFPSEKGRDLLKQVRTHLIETAKPLLQALVQEISHSNVRASYQSQPLSLSFRASKSLATETCGCSGSYCLLGLAFLGPRCAFG